MHFQTLGPLRVTNGDQREIALIPELKYLVKRHPLSEHLRAQLMLAMYRAGRQAEALGVYRTGRRIMPLVDARIAQGRLDEAGGWLERAAPWAAPDDLDALFRQARSRARYELARGNLEAAEAAARKAFHLLDDTEAADDRAEAGVVLARVLLAAGRDDEARAAAAEALETSERRENVVVAQWSRELLATVEQDYVGLHT